MARIADFTLIGAGIMSATLGILLHELFPDSTIRIYERLDRVGAESSDAWNNAGTGHSAFCELNYTPVLSDGSVDITKALKISEAFEISKQFWAYLVETQKVKADTPFINDIDHMSFVWGDENIAFLKKRFYTLKPYSMFDDMLYSEDFDEIAMWVPLMMRGRQRSEKIAATRMDIGTDVNFGALTRGMINYLENSSRVKLYLGHHVEDLEQEKDGIWRIDVEDLKSNVQKSNYSKFVFIGAGGGSIPLLEKADVPASRGYGGFPVSGKFLTCTNPDIVIQHEAKVYGKAAVGSPPMSVPHLDTRMLDGKRSLLFGPYAGFSTKFLKKGSYFDLPLSLEVHNVWPMLSAGAQNIELTKYLIDQVFQSPEERFDMLVQYYPEAKFEDWKLITAGQRVQIIKKEKNKGGMLKFGTEIVASADRSISALLGASPGASTAVAIMLDVLKICFPRKMQETKVHKKISEIIPSFGRSLIENGQLCNEVRHRTTRILKLEAT